MLCARYKLKKDTKTHTHTTSEQQNKLSLTHTHKQKKKNKQANEQFVWYIYQKNNNKTSDTEEHTLKCINV